MSDNILVFSFVAFLTVVTPGPTVLLAFANGTRAGFRMAFFGILGAVVSDFLLIGTVALGLGAILLASKTLFEVVRWIGVLYLAWLGMRMIIYGAESPGRRSSGGLNFSRKDLFLRSLFVAITNPKGYLFFSALLPQFIVPDSARAVQYVTLASIFASIDFSVMIAYALLGRQAGLCLASKAIRRFERLGGFFLVALSVSLAMYRRQR